MGAFPGALTFFEAPPKTGKFNTKQACNLPNQHTTLPHAAGPHKKISKMSTLLRIAARVEAAVEAYNSIRGFANKTLWKAGFEREMVCTHAHGAYDASFNRPPFELGLR